MEMAKLRTELFEMQIQGYDKMDENENNNGNSSNSNKSYDDQYDSPRDYIPPSSLSLTPSMEYSSDYSEKHTAVRRQGLSPVDRIGSTGAVSTVSTSNVRPPSGNAIKAANALRQSNATLIELNASTSAN